MEYAFFDEQTFRRTEGAGEGRAWIEEMRKRVQHVANRQARDETRRAQDRQRASEADGDKLRKGDRRV